MFILLAALSLNIVLGMDDVCKKNVSDVCVIPLSHVDTYDFGKYMDETCVLFLEYIDCIHNHDEICRGISDPTFAESEFYVRFREVISEFCANISNLRTAFSENIDCIISIMAHHNESCDRPRKQLLQAYVSYLGSLPGRKRRIRQSQEELMKYHCLKENFDIACAAQNCFEECGLDATNLGLTMARATIFFRYSCKPEMYSELLNIVDDLDWPGNKVLLKEILKLH